MTTPRRDPSGAGYPVATSDCGCGRADLPVEASFCDTCGTALDDLVLPDPADVGDPDGLRAPQTPRIEQALTRTLADVCDGHIGLWGTPGQISVDRLIDPRLARLDWVLLFLLRGWVTQARGHRTLIPTPAGRAHVAQHLPGRRS